MALPQGRLTLEEFLRLPEEKPALELIDGAVTQKMAPAWDHSVTYTCSGPLSSVTSGRSSKQGPEFVRLLRRQIGDMDDMPLGFDDERADGQRSHGVLDTP